MLISLWICSLLDVKLGVIFSHFLKYFFQSHPLFCFFFSITPIALMLVPYGSIIFSSLFFLFFYQPINLYIHSPIISSASWNLLLSPNIEFFIYVICCLLYIILKLLLIVSIWWEFFTIYLFNFKNIFF